MTAEKLLALAEIQRELNLALVELAEHSNDFWTTFKRLSAGVDAIGAWVEEPLNGLGYYRETVQ